jgi:hypothetical protein
MHDLAARPTGAVKSAVAIAIETMILLNIDLRIAWVRPRVEESVQWIPRLFRNGRGGAMVRETCVTFVKILWRRL